MNYGQLKTLALQLAFSESIAGTQIPLSYNNQEDYVKMIPGLANDGMVYIATTVKKIPEVIPLNMLPVEDAGEYNMYTLPSDYYKLMNGGLIWQRPDMPYDMHYTLQRFHGYRLYGYDKNKKLLIPKRTPNLDNMLVEYYRYPHKLPDYDPADPDYDSIELDNTEDTHTALPYYVASQLVMYDDPFRYTALHNEFETRLSRITEPITTEYAPVEDVYFGFNLPGAY